jgi:lipoprotein-anchoring transpeptidase ErfK/SrfK
LKIVAKIVVGLIVLVTITSVDNVFCLEKNLGVSEKVTVTTATPVSTPTLNPTQSPVIISTPIPQPTEIPFSDLAPTILMSAEELTWDDRYTGEEPNSPSAGTYKLVVNIYYQFVIVFRKDKNGEFTVPVRYMVCTTGKESTPTPDGTFLLQGNKIRIITSDENSYARYATQLIDGIYFHSLLYKKWDDVTSYTATSYNNLGTRASHGCIRLWVPDAKWIYYNIAVGTEVEVAKGEENEALAHIRAQLIFPPYTD